MGRKSFIEDYDPLKAHLVRDHERVGRNVLTIPRREQGTPSQTQDAAALCTNISQPIGADHFRAAPSRSEPMVDVSRRATASSRNQRADVRTGMADNYHEISARVKVSGAAFQDLETMLAQIQLATGSKVHYSIATRALWGLLVQAEATVVEEIQRDGLGRLPCTRDRVEYANYEEKVRRAFARAFRKLPSSHFETPAVAEPEQGLGR